MTGRRRSTAGGRVVLRRCESPAEAEVWAAAFRSVLTSLDIAAWWRVRIDTADAGALLVGVDYQPLATPGRARSPFRRRLALNGS